MAHWRRERLVRHGRRSRAPSRLRADRQREPGLLRRPEARRQQMGELHRRASRADRHGRVGISARASRSLGLRHGVAAAAGDRHARPADRPGGDQSNKTGLLYVLHRDTGEPVFPVEERRVPQSDVPGETSSPTQPFPTAFPPLTAQRFAETDVWGATPADACGLSRQHPGSAERGRLHAAERSRDARGAGTRRRSKLERIRL